MSIDQSETANTNSAQSLLVVNPAQPRRTPLNANYRPQATFVAQVIAAKTGAPIYRAKRRASTFEALTAYSQNGERKIVRMPAGYLRTLSA